MTQKISDAEITYGDTYWDDMKFPFSRTKRGSSDLPHFDCTNIGLLFPQNDATEIVYMIGQMTHAWKEGTSIYPHIHYIQTSASIPVFKLSYRWYNNGDTVPSYTTITSTTLAFAYTSGSILQILKFPVIVGTGKTLSSILDMKVYRDDNVVSGDVLGKEFDIHFEINAPGSRQEYIK